MSELSSAEKAFKDLVASTSEGGRGRLSDDVVVTKAMANLKTFSRCASGVSDAESKVHAHMLAAQAAQLLFCFLNQDDKDDVADARDAAKLGVRHVDGAMALLRRGERGGGGLDVAESLFEDLVVKVAAFFRPQKLHVRMKLFRELAAVAGPAHRARIWMAAADAALKLAVTQIGEGDYGAATTSMAQGEQPMAELSITFSLFYARDAMSGAVEDLEDSVKRTRTEATTMAHINCGKSFWEKALQECEHNSREMVWRAVDEFHNARVVAEQFGDTKAEAIASSYIARIFFSYFRDNNVARAHAYNSLTLGLALTLGQQGLEWLEEAKHILSNIQGMEEMDDEGGFRAVREGVQKGMEANLAVLNVEKEKGYLGLLQQMYELYPPKKRTKAALPHKYPSSAGEQRKLLQSIIEDYDFANQTGDGVTAEWKAVCEILKETYVNPLLSDVKGV